jgi:tryptophanyl-tRNA synthetase
MSVPRMLTGDRPTGRLHLGHYVGSIANRVALHQRYESYFIIADLHMLTTRHRREDIAQVSRNAREMVTDVLACGVDPARATFYLQSAIPEVGDLNTLFQNLVTVPRLERVPSVREMDFPTGSRCSAIPSCRRRTSSASRRRWCRSARTTRRTSR